jgi:hypothetical protein
MVHILLNKCSICKTLVDLCYRTLRIIRNFQTNPLTLCTERGVWQMSLSFKRSPADHVLCHLGFEIDSSDSPSPFRGGSPIIISGANDRCHQCDPESSPTIAKTLIAINDLHVVIDECFLFVEFSHSLLSAGTSRSSTNMMSLVLA